MPSSIDLRAEVRAEAVALQPHAHYVHAFVDSPVASVIWSPENLILDVNHAMCEFVGFERDDLIGRSARI